MNKTEESESADMVVEPLRCVGYNDVRNNDFTIACGFEDGVQLYSLETFETNHVLMKNFNISAAYFAHHLQLVAIVGSKEPMAENEVMLWDMKKSEVRETLRFSSTVVDILLNETFIVVIQANQVSVCKLSDFKTIDKFATVYNPRGLGKLSAASLLVVPGEGKGFIRLIRYEADKNISTKTIEAHAHETVSVIALNNCNSVVGTCCERELAVKLFDCESGDLIRIISLDTLLDSINIEVTSIAFNCTSSHFAAVLNSGVTYLCAVAGKMINMNPGGKVETNCLVDFGAFFNIFCGLATEPVKECDSEPCIVFRGSKGKVVPIFSNTLENILYMISLDTSEVAEYTLSNGRCYKTGVKTICNTIKDHLHELADDPLHEEVEEEVEEEDLMSYTPLSFYSTDSKYDADSLPIILDLGSRTCRAGFANEELPRLTFASMVGTPKYFRTVDVTRQASFEDYYIGQEAEAKRGVLSLRYPIQRGIVKDWKDMEKIFNYIFEKKLNVRTEDHPIMLTESPLNSLQNRKEMEEIMFETYQVPAINFQIPAVLSMYASGKTTGLALDIGDGVTHALPIIDGNPLKYAIQSSNIAGSDITAYLSRILMEQGHQFSTTAELEIVRQMKEKLTYVAVDFGSEMSKAKANLNEAHYELPDGRVITLNNERFRASELLFEGNDQPAVQLCAYLAIHKCECEDKLKNELYRNILLCGGTTMLPGFSDRLRKELNSFSRESIDINISGPNDRMNSAWIGGSVLAGLDTFRGWVSKDDYNESGFRSQ